MPDAGDVYKVRISDNTYWVIDSGARNAIAQDYDSSHEYSVGDVVFHSNALYQCSSETTGEWDSSCWAAKTIFEIVAGMIQAGGE